MNSIDSISCHPKNKLLIYHQFVLPKLSWHITVADLSKTWVDQNLTHIVTKYIRQWLDLPISATLSTLALKKSKYGITLILPSTKFTQRQTVIRNALKTSPNLDINAMWAVTGNGSNIQYDQYKNTKQVLIAIQQDLEDCIKRELQSHACITPIILKLSNSETHGLWSTAQWSRSKLRNIFTCQGIKCSTPHTPPVATPLMLWSMIKI